MAPKIPLVFYTLVLVSQWTCNVCDTNKTRVGFNCENTKNLEGFKLATLFTTWPLVRHRERRFIFENMVKNWRELGSRIQIVVFTNETEIIKFCRERKIDVLPEGSTAAGGRPILKEMYLETMKYYKSVFYSFVNSDILFSPNMADILSMVVDSKLCKCTPIFMMGARTNVLVDSRNANLSWTEIEALAKSNGTLHPYFYSLDYFLTSVDYPWTEIAEVAIGLPDYDNYLIWNANRLKHVTINLTNALFCVHQGFHKLTGESEKGPYRDYDGKLIKDLHRECKYHKSGQTNCADYLIGYKHGTNELFLTQSRMLTSNCYKIC